MKRENEMKTKKWVMFVLAIMSVILVSCGNNTKNEEVKVKTPAAAKELEKQDYQDVQKRFKKAGFTKIKLTEDPDLKLGLFAKENSVEKVSIDGDTEFTENEEFDPNAEVEIVYHTYPKTSSEEISESSSTFSSTTESSTESSITDSKEIKNTTQSSKEDTSNQILTEANNSEFANILNGTGAEADNRAFVDKYQGRTIEFDGYIADLALKANKKTRYDMLLLPGDYIPDTAKGSYFQFPDTNLTSDLHWVEENRPSAIGNNQNLHIIAEITGASQDAQIIYLKPIETRAR